MTIKIAAKRYIFLYSKKLKSFETLLIELKNQDQIESLRLRARLNPNKDFVVGEATFAQAEVDLFNNKGPTDPEALFKYVSSGKTRNFMEHSI